jgi:hypothetical protein
LPNNEDHIVQKKNTILAYTWAHEKGWAAEAWWSVRELCKAENVINCHVSENKCCALACSGYILLPASDIKLHNLLD